MTTTKAEQRLQRATDLVSERHPEAVKPVLNRVLPLDQGHTYESFVLYIVYERPGANLTYQPRSVVYFPPFDAAPLHFDSTEEFINWYAGRRSKMQGLASASPLTKLLEQSGGIAGSLAFMITAAIIYKYLRNTAAAFDVPTVLASALSTVLGFYFGGKTKEAAQSSRTAKDVE